MTTDSTFRTEMIEARQAPDQSRGVLGWFRANLFSGPINIVP